MIQQQRIYEIFERNKAAFHARFRDHAARIMQTRYGFQIGAMWETMFGEKTEFAYLLEWPDEATKTAAWAAFMADTEWSDIKRVTHAEHGLMVGQSEDRLRVPVARTFTSLIAKKNQKVPIGVVLACGTECPHEFIVRDAVDQHALQRAIDDTVLRDEIGHEADRPHLP